MSTGIANPSVRDALEGKAPDSCVARRFRRTTTLHFVLRTFKFDCDAPKTLEEAGTQICLTRD